MAPEASFLVTYGIASIALLMALLYVGAQAVAAQRLAEPVSRVARGTVGYVLVWCALSAMLAHFGVLSRFDLEPPPMALMVVAVIGSGLVLGLSRPGTRLVAGIPLAWLVMAQGFRLPLELVMHQAASERVMPVEMSFAGYNFDVLTGAGALLVGGLSGLGRAPRSLLWAWNVLGMVALAVIVVVALASSPMIRAFGDDPAHINTWVTYFPFVWLPTVLVVIAVFGHVVITRKLLRGAVGPTSDRREAVTTTA